MGNTSGSGAVVARGFDDAQAARALPHKATPRDAAASRRWRAWWQRARGAPYAAMRSGRSGAAAQKSDAAGTSTPPAAARQDERGAAGHFLLLPPLIPAGEAVMCCAARHGAALAFTDAGNAIAVGASAPAGATWRAHARSVSSAAFGALRAGSGGSAGGPSPAGWGRAGWLVTGSRDLSVKCWTAPGELAVEAAAAHELSVAAVAAGPCGVWASGSRDTSVKVWTAREGDGTACVLWHASLPRNIVTCLAFLGSSSGSHHHRNNNNNNNNNDSCNSSRHGLGGDGDGAEAEPHGLVAQGSEDLAVRLWDWRRGPGAGPAATLSGYTFFCTRLCETTDGLLVTACKGVGGEGGEVVAWDLRQPREPLARMRGHGEEVVGCAPLGRSRFATMAKDNRLLVWDLRAAVGEGQGGAGPALRAPFASPATAMVPCGADAVLAASLRGEVAHLALPRAPA